MKNMVFRVPRRSQPQSTVTAPNSTRRPPAGPFEKELEKVTRDNKLSRSEWVNLKIKLMDKPLGAPETRATFEAYANRSLRFDDDVARDMAMFLGERGYLVSPQWVASDGTVERPVQVEVALQGNVAEPDPDFDRLSELTGRLQSRLRMAVLDGGFVAHDLLRDNLPEHASVRRGQPIGVEFGPFTPAERLLGQQHGTHVTGIATRGTSRIEAALYSSPLNAGDDAAVAALNRGPTIGLTFRALKAAAESGARVVNASIEVGVDEKGLLELKALIDAHPNTLFVIGAGNDGAELGQLTTWPRRVAESVKAPNLVVVGASASSGERLSESNYSPQWVGLVARGHNVMSAHPDGHSLHPLSGTSMASPQVANLAAKCLLLSEDLRPAQVIALMAATSDAHPGWSGSATAPGPINPTRAMSAAAVLELKRQGLAEDQAFDKLSISVAERPLLRSALATPGRL